MTIEHAFAEIVHKPWGKADVRPWSQERGEGREIGELLFQTPGARNTEPALLLKLLFTQKPLSIQVHPGDQFAQSIGLKSGKSEAWFILSAEPGARVAVGLRRQITERQLRTAIEDGSIADLLAWNSASEGDVVFVPAGTIHAIGPGLVIAEIQQRSDATFRLFDYGSDRQLHTERAIQVANLGQASPRSAPKVLTDTRVLLVASQHFVFERFALPAASSWLLNASCETWILAVEGQGSIGSINVSAGDAVFAESDRCTIEAGLGGMTGLLAYASTAPLTNILLERDRCDDDPSLPPLEAPPSTGSMPLFPAARS